MPIDKSSLKVENNVAKKRFEVKVDDQFAYAEYMRVANRIIFTHTEVPRGLEGNGLGSMLAKTGLEFAKSESLKVVPLCPYIAGYIKKHREYLPLVMEGYNVG